MIGIQVSRDEDIRGTWLRLLQSLVSHLTQSHFNFLSRCKLLQQKIAPNHLFRDQSWQKSRNCQIFLLLFPGSFMSKKIILFLRFISRSVPPGVFPKFCLYLSKIFFLSYFYYISYYAVAFTSFSGIPLSIHK